MPKAKILIITILFSLTSTLIQSGFTRKDEKLQLIQAVKLQRGDDVRNLFLVYMINPNYNDAIGHSPLYYAVMSGNLDTIEALLNNGADPDFPTKYRTETVTGIQLAYRTLGRKQALPVIKLLLKEGRANPNAVNRNGDGLLYFATRDGNVALLDLIANNENTNVNIQNNNGNTALHEAVKKGQEDSVIVLIGQGADANIANNEGKTPLDIAIANNNSKIITLLLGQPR